MYVSLIPGSVPTGLQARITDQATGLAVTTAVVAGGFDPVAILASIGDTLFVEIAREGDAPLHGFAVVRATRPPVVVRTSPPPGGRDVPLNAIVVIVFSEPLDTATVDTGSVKLWRGSTPVPGTVRFADVERLRAQFHPDGLLAGQTDYELVLSQGIRDVSGEALEAAVTVPFTTGVTEQVAASLAFFEEPSAVGVGQTFTVKVAIRDALGNLVLSATDSVTLTLGANPGGATLRGTLTVAADQGVATFRDLSLDRAASGYTLAATAGTLAGAVSAPLTVIGPSEGFLLSAVSAGQYHTCGVTAAGAAYCWGTNNYGQIGDGTIYGDRSTPVLVAGGLNFATVSAGWHTCGVTVAGAAYCWGENTTGQLGDGTTTDRLTPALVAGGLSFVTVSAGGNHTCGVTVAGAAHCWGENATGQLGDGTTTDRLTPALVAGGLTFATVSAGLDHTCGVTAEGAAYCWGSGGFGQLGDGANLGDGISDDRASPVLVAGGLTFATVSAGNFYTCGVMATGAAYCWGTDYWLYGVLGWGGSAPSFGSTPSPVAGGVTFAAVSASYRHSCGVTVTGAVYCWGYNRGGVLGIGIDVAYQYTPARVVQ